MGESFLLTASVGYCMQHGPLLAVPVLTEGLSGSWKEGAPSSSSSSGYWSWSAPSDQSNPSTPSPPLSADSFKPFRSPAPPDDGIDEAEASNLLFDEPIPRKRKVGYDASCSALTGLVLSHSWDWAPTPCSALVVFDIAIFPDSRQKWLEYPWLCPVSVRVPSCVCVVKRLYLVWSWNSGLRPPVPKCS